MGRRSNIDWSSVSSIASVILNQLEGRWSSMEKDIVKSYHDVSDTVYDYIKDHPWVSMATGVCAGMAAVALLTKSRRTSRSAVNELLSKLADDVKNYSGEICDSFISSYVREKPVRATGTALVAAVLLNLLAKR